MQLQEIFLPDRIIMNLKSVNKEDLFIELSDIIAEKYKINNKNEILETITEREKKFSTGIQKGIAIPHGKTNAVSGVLGLLGISRKGIEYDSLDGQPVRLVFLIVSSEDKAEEHLAILKRLAILLEKTNFIEELINATDQIKASEIISRYENTILS